MKIESILRREGGSRITMGGVEYHFAPGEDGRHVCEVGDEGHAERLLAIPEGFREVDVDTSSKASPAAPQRGKAK